MHAEYNRALDDYLTHRLIQAFDTAQFIECTRGNSALQILAGDLNSEPEDLGYRLMILTSGLHDLYDQNSLNGTNGCAKNSYSTLAEITNSPEGKRIDYVLVRSSDDFRIRKIIYSHPLPERVLDETFSYSDHEAVQAKITIDIALCRNEDKKYKLEYQTEAIKENLSESIRIVNKSLAQLRTDKKNYLIFAITIILFLLNLIEVQAPHGFQAILLLFKLILILAVVFFPWNGFHLDRN